MYCDAMHGSHKKEISSYKTALQQTHQQRSLTFQLGHTIALRMYTDFLEQLPYSTQHIAFGTVLHCFKK